jgi:hypothetical protein
MIPSMPGAVEVVSAPASAPSATPAPSGGAASAPASGFSPRELETGIRDTSTAAPEPAKPAEKPAPAAEPAKPKAKDDFGSRISRLSQENRELKRQVAEAVARTPRDPNLTPEDQAAKDDAWEQQLWKQPKAVIEKAIAEGIAQGISGIKSEMELNREHEVAVKANQFLMSRPEAKDESYREELDEIGERYPSLNAPGMDPQSASEMAYLIYVGARSLSAAGGNGATKPEVEAPAAPPAANPNVIPKAALTSPGGTAAPTAKRVWTTSEIEALSRNPVEYAKVDAEIDEAQREGRIVNR